MAASSLRYTLHYWPVIPGRGEFVRLAFESVGQAYADNGDVKNFSKLTMSEKGVDNPTHFAPPVLEVAGASKLEDDDDAVDIDGGASKAQKTQRDQDAKSAASASTFISQTPAILNYLAPILGLDGTHSLRSKSEDAVALRRANVLQLVCTALDLNNETHDTHHPVAVGEYYEEQKDEAARKAADFRANRLPKFFKHFTLALQSNTTGSGWLIGSDLTVADLTVYQVVDGLHFAFPKRIATLRKAGDYDALFAHYEKVASVPSIAKYLKSDRRKPYSDGVFRYYKELDIE